jgi:hypothetical protein
MTSMTYALRDLSDTFTWSRRLRIWKRTGTRKSKRAGARKSKRAEKRKLKRTETENLSVNKNLQNKS